MIGGVIAFPVMIAAGRIIGPEEFGRYLLIINAAAIFSVLFNYGLDISMQRQLPKHPDKKYEIVKTLSLILLVTTLTASVSLIVTKSIWIKWLGLSNELFWWALVMGIFSTLMVIYEACHRGLNNFKILVKSNIFQSIILLITFSILIFSAQYTHVAITLSTLLGIFGAAMVYILGPKKRFKIKIDLTMAKQMLKYTTLIFFAAITGVIASKAYVFFLNQMTSLYWVGIYGAYLTGSNLFMNRIFTPFYKVYFPAISGTKDKRLIFKLLRRGLIRSFPIIFIASVILIYATVRLFGQEYVLLPSLIILFALSNALSVIYLIYQALLHSQGVRGAKTVTIALTIKAFISLSLLYILIPIWGIYGAITTTIIANTIFALIYIYKAKVFLKNDYFNEAF